MYGRNNHDIAKYPLIKNFKIYYAERKKESPNLQRVVLISPWPLLSNNTNVYWAGFLEEEECFLLTPFLGVVNAIRHPDLGIIFSTSDLDLLKNSLLNILNQE